MPDAITLLKFRHLLERHEIRAAMFAKFGELLMANGMRLSGGTIVDVTLIAAPPTTKNEDKARDPEMHQAKTGNEWHFGMKLPIGADSRSRMIHRASVTSANVHDSSELGHLLTRNETRLYGDRAYRGKNQRERLRQVAPTTRRTSLTSAPTGTSP